MARFEGELGTIPNGRASSGSNTSEDRDIAAAVTEDHFELDQPGSLILNCDHIITAIVESCSRSTLGALMSVSRQLGDLVAPLLYGRVRLDNAAIPSFFFGATTGGLHAERLGDSGRRSKPELLALTRVLTLESHDGDVCALNVAGAAYMTGLEILRIVMTMNDEESIRLCSHPQCEFLQVLQPRKVVIRNCNGRTHIPLDLRWSLPVCVKTAVLVLPTSAQEYYDPEGDPLSPLTQSLSGKFRLVSKIKIVFWEDFEGPAPSRDFLPNYRRRRVLVDDLVPLIQNAICTNHRPWPRVKVYGLETLSLKAGSGSALARMYGLTDPHELVQHALGISHHSLVQSPWTKQKVPYRIPDIVWEEIDSYEEDEDSRMAEINEDDD